MKFKILFISIVVVGGCVTRQSRTTASISACNDGLKGPAQAELSDETISSCFEESLAKGESIGFSQIGGEVSNLAKESVADYVDVWAYLINKALRTNDSSYIRKNQGKLNRLDQSLEQYPIYRGVVFRGSEFPPAEKLEKNITFKDLAFLSTSQDISIAEHYAGVNGYLNVILSKSGRILSYNKKTEELSGEKEILFPRGASFKVYDIKNKNGITLVFLIEQ